MALASFVALPRTALRPEVSSSTTAIIRSSSALAMPMSSWISGGSHRWMSSSSVVQ
uniref:Uncharacterized protein n=1 Tax=Arundo donax TaxID=35708 RepID=A0A0A9F2I6_ARUDO